MAGSSPGYAPGGRPIQPCSPPVAQIRFVAIPLRVWRRMRPPVPMDSSSGCAMTTSRPPLCSSIARLGYAVFHLPRVVERVPRDAPYRVGNGPLRVFRGMAHGLEQPLAVVRLHAQADRRRISNLGVDHVLEHLVAVAAAPARSFAKVPWNFRPHLVEILPAGFEQRDQ